MKRWIGIMLLFTLNLPAPARAQSPVGDGGSVPPRSTTMACIEKGAHSGSRTSTGGALAIGVVSGVGLGLIGTGLAWAFQGEPLPPAAELNALDSAECRVAYKDSYGEQGKRRKRSAALTGGLIGTAVLLGVVAASSGGE
jgi:hypothetical protein